MTIYHNFKYHFKEVFIHSRYLHINERYCLYFVLNIFFTVFYFKLFKTTKLVNCTPICDKHAFKHI